MKIAGDCSSIALLGNPQPPSRVIGGSYGIETFQISIKILQGSAGLEATEGRVKRQAKSKEKRSKGN